MHPILFEIAGREVSSYAVMLVLALVAAAIVVAVEMRRRGWDPALSIEALTLAGVAGIVGRGDPDRVRRRTDSGGGTGRRARCSACR